MICFCGCYNFVDCCCPCLRFELCWFWVLFVRWLLLVICVFGYGFGVDDLFCWVLGVFWVVKLFCLGLMFLVLVCLVFDFAGVWIGFGLLFSVCVLLFVFWGMLSLIWVALVGCLWFLLRCDVGLFIDSVDDLVLLFV